MAKKPSPAPGIDQAIAAPPAKSEGATPNTEISADAPIEGKPAESPETQTDVGAAGNDLSPANAKPRDPEPRDPEPAQEVGAGASVNDVDAEGSDADPFHAGGTLDGAGVTSAIPIAFSGATPQPSPAAVEFAGLAIDKAFGLIGQHAPDGLRLDFSQQPAPAVRGVLETLAPAMQVLIGAAGVSNPLLGAFLSSAYAAFVTHDGRKHTVQRP